MFVVLTLALLWQSCIGTDDLLDKVSLGSELSSLPFDAVIEFQAHLSRTSNVTDVMNDALNLYIAMGKFEGVAQLRLQVIESSVAYIVDNNWTTDLSQNEHSIYQSRIG